ncbi:MAG: rRNA pseudouridine synthase [Pirellulales bacterium]|nr:rRNA pseudouridine synthase [Pirellulales bacterium]
MPKHSKHNDRKPRYGGSPERKHRRAKGPMRGADATDGPIRLQKVLAAAGVGSRRQCEELIAEGRVDVDGQTVTELGTRVDPQRQEIRVDGERLRRPKRVYLLINKPIGVISTSDDPSGRARVIDLAPTRERLFTVGRLDKSSDGLILATNDGELTDLLTHPRYGVEKTYLAEVAGVPSAESVQKLRKGVHLAEGYAHAKRVHVRRSHKHSTVMEMVLDEGRNREVRRLLARIGHKVLKLRRIAIGPLRLGALKPGESRSLRAEEVEQLYRVARAGRKKDPTKQRAAKTDGPLRAKPKSDDRRAIRPSIDKSIPSGDDTGDLSYLWNDPPSDQDELSDFEQTVAPALEEAEVSPIDLSPIEPGGMRRRDRRPQPTLIGAKPKTPRKDRTGGVRGRKIRQQRGRR